MYPRIIIDIEKYRHNVKYMLKKCHDYGLSMMAVSKVYCADQELIKVLEEEKVDYIADSRIQNLITINTSIPKVLLRLPLHGETKNVVQYSNISLNSELSTIALLNKYAKDIDVKHGIILMIDLGDLREGIFDIDELYDTVEKVLNMTNITLRGIGVNLTCYGGVIPTSEILSKLVDYKKKIEEKFGINLDIISGGNSSNIDLLLKNEIPEGINNLRLGESLVLGRETAFGDFIDNTFDDVFTLESDIIELKVKPSIPIGEVGMNAFGKKPTFEDKGLVTRAIIGIGKQDVDHNEIIPYDTIEVLGSSSDHIILDVTDGYNKYEVGDYVLFKLTYSSILSLMTSKYVTKYYER